MRLSKKIAASALAVAMSLTMLAGCGSTPAPAPTPTPAPGNNTSNSTTNSNTNSGNTNTGNNNNNSNSSASSETTTPKPETTTSNWQKSRTYQYVKLLNGEEVGIDTEWTVKESNGSNTTLSYIYEKYGAGNIYMNAKSGGNEAQALLQNGAYYFTNNDLELNSGKQLYIKVEIDDFEQQEWSDTLAAPKNLLEMVLSPTKPNSIKSGTKQMGSSVYDVESFERVLEGETAQVECYFIGTTLKYIKCVSSTETATIRINKLTNRANSSYFRVPAYAEICIVDKYGNIYDENHNYVGKL